MSFEKVNVKVLDQYRKRFKDRDSFILLDSASMDVSDFENFRKDLFRLNSQVLVCKKSLLKIFFEENNYGEWGDLGASRMAVVLIDENPLGVLRIIKKYEDDSEKITIKSGFFEGSFVDKQGIKTLSKIPSREFLLTKLYLVTKSPVQNFHGVLKAVLQKMAGVVRAIKEQKEDSQSQ